MRDPRRPGGRSYAGRRAPDPPAPRRATSLRRAPTARRAQLHARRRLRRFRQGSILLVALTALLLLLLAPETQGQEPAPEEEDVPLRVPDDPAVALDEATSTLFDLYTGFIALLPKLVIAALCLLLAWGVTHLLRWTIRRTLADWKRGSAVVAMGTFLTWLLGLGAALSVVAGDSRALVGSVGLTGLALSWALQAPIESFTGWLLNSFRGYYRVGDRIAVGDVFGDVYQIDMLTTMVWEAGGPDKPVQGAQPTGALVTFPNSELLRTYVTNLTRDFPWVWDEVTVQVGNDSDLAFVLDLVRDEANRTLGEDMARAAAAYEALWERSRLGHEVAPEAQVFLRGADFWTEVTVRYLVSPRQRRVWATRLYLAIMTALSRPEHAARVRPAAVQEQVWVVGRTTDRDPWTGAS